MKMQGSLFQYIAHWESSLCEHSALWSVRLYLLVYAWDRRDIFLQNFSIYHSSEMSERVEEKKKNTSFTKIELRLKGP